MMLPLLFAIYNALSAANPPAYCSVKAQPRLSLAPLRVARMQVTVEPRSGDEPWRQADLILTGDGMEIRSSRLWEGDSALKAPRTTWVTWELPNLPPGEYQVSLVVQAQGGVKCMAADKLTVNGEQP